MDSYFSAFKSCVIAKDAQLSAEVDLDGIYDELLVIMPAIDSAAISVRISDKSGGTFLPVHDFLDADGDGTVLQASTAGTGSIAVIFKIGGAQFIKLYAGASQTTAAVTFTVRGIKR